MTRNLIPLQVSTKAVSYLYTRLSDMSISLMLLFSMKRMSSYLDSLWIKQVFPSLVSCKKWKKEFRNLKVGDICLLFYPGALAGSYKLVVSEGCRYTSRRKRFGKDCNNFDEEKKAKEKAEELNNKKGMNKEQVGVQRLIVIRPVDDQVPTDGNLCIDKVVQPVVDQVQGCDIKVRANVVDAAVQPINHPPHQVPLFSLTMYSSLLSNLTM